MDAMARTKLLETFIKDKLPTVAARCSVEHIFKGKWNERKLAGVSLLEVPSKTLCDETLKTIQSSNVVLCDGSDVLRFDFAGTKRQLHRNACVHKAN